MPLYDFKCEECDYIEEILTSYAEKIKTVLTCPECEKETMKRQVSLSSFQLKGGGWSKDGYEKKPGDPGHRLQPLKFNKKGKIQDDPDRPFKGIKKRKPSDIEENSKNKTVKGNWIADI